MPSGKGKGTMVVVPFLTLKGVQDNERMANGNLLV